MDFWNSYKARAVGNFADAPLRLETAARKNASLKAVSEFSSELEINRRLSSTMTRCAGT